jgi:DNA-binding transcriptional MocR family regulator
MTHARTLSNKIEPPRPSPLDRRSGIPLYHQIQQRLLEQIQSGEMKAGEPLPSIERIAARMGVSQMTVRQAVRALCDLGVIYSRQGKGTFISAIKLELWPAVPNPVPVSSRSDCRSPASRPGKRFCWPTAKRSSACAVCATAIRSQWALKAAACLHFSAPA